MRSMSFFFNAGKCGDGWRIRGHERMELCKAAYAGCQQEYKKPRVLICDGFTCSSELRIQV